MEDRQPPPSPGEASREDLRAVLRQHLLPAASEAELDLAARFCERTRLDPLSGQVHFIRRRGREGAASLRPQVSIDGFRLIAERTGTYAGQVGPWWCGDDEVWHEVWLDDRHPPRAARVGVMRHGFSEPLFAVAHWHSYVQRDREGRPTRFWASMPEVMLAKVAEALALRKAFPLELGGIYSAEELAQAEHAEVGDEPAGLEARKAALRKQLGNMCDAHGIDRRAMAAWGRRLYPQFDSLRALGPTELADWAARVRRGERPPGLPAITLMPEEAPVTRPGQG
ncbi:MAG: phage recombination protein Bet [Candidatus Sericytochromatia bacterium]|nr:phage recombination protein Bet [Candidatus Sericytochromatia bacterium]